MANAINPNSQNIVLNEELVSPGFSSRTREYYRLHRVVKIRTHTEFGLRILTERRAY